MTLPAILAFFGFLAALHHYYKSRRTFLTKGLPLPPGPKRWPFIGSLLSLRTREKPWLLYRRWSEQYGDLIYVQLLQTPMIIVNSAEIAFELLEKRSRIYSDRPASVIDEIFGWDWNFGFMPYGPAWRTRRRIFHHCFNENVLKKYHEFITQHVQAFLRRTASSAGTPECINLQLLVTSVIVDVVYGIKITNLDDEYVTLATKASRGFVAAKNPGQYWVDYFPIIRYIPPWFPGAAARKAGKLIKAYTEQLRNQPFYAVKNAQAPIPCVVDDLLSKPVRDGLDSEASEAVETCYKDVAAVAYGAGVDTTLALISFFMCAMAKYPEIQIKARMELDRVVGRHRLPDFSDYDSLPYIQAIVLESTRWIPPTHLALPHALSEADEYRGFFIPKGTIVFANVWAMLHDPNKFPDPEKFDPDRFMKNGRLDLDVRSSVSMSFGFGRRACPGQHFAKDLTFLTVACVLHLFEISAALDKDGKPVDPMPDVDGTILATPKHLTCSVKQRSSLAEQFMSHFPI